MLPIEQVDKAEVKHPLKNYSLPIIIQVLSVSKYKKAFEEISGRIEEENRNLCCPITQALMTEPVY